MINLHEQFYNLKADPFRLSSDYRFAFAHKSYRNAISYLKFALYSEEGFIVITGRPGTGKTTLINELISQLDTKKYKVATLVTTQYEAHDLLHMIASAFGIRTDTHSKSSILLSIEKFLHQQHAEGNRVLLIVDEAQGLKRDAVEELRLLSNLQADGKPLLQIFLIGQEEFRNIIESPDLEQLRQRVIASSHLDVLNEDETTSYIIHRLEHAGWAGDPKITRGVALLVHHFSGGIPRIINLLCGRLLFHGCMEEKHELNSEDMKSVLEELSDELLVIDSSRAFTEIIDRLEVVESEFLQPASQDGTLNTNVTRIENLNQEVRALDLEQVRPDTAERYLDDTVSVLHGNTVKKVNSPAFEAGQPGQVPEQTVEHIPEGPAGLDAETRADKPVFMTTDNKETEVEIPEGIGDESAGRRIEDRKSVARPLALTAVITGLLALTLVSYAFITRQQSGDIIASRQEAEQMQSPVEVQQSEVQQYTDLSTIPAHDAVSLRVKEQEKAVSIIKGIDFSVYEKKAGGVAGQETGGRGQYMEHLDRENTSAGEAQASKQRQTFGKKPVIAPQASPDAQKYGTNSVNETLHRAAARPAKTAVTIPAKHDGQLSQPTVRQEVMPDLQSYQSLQGVEGFDADKQRKYLFEGSWHSKNSPTDFLPSDKVYCKDFVTYISCWRVPEFTRTRDGAFKKVVESRISGFTDKGSFNVTSTVKTYKLGAEDGRQSAGSQPKRVVETTTSSKRCVFIDHNYISCSKEQGVIERYSRATQ